MAFIRPLVCLFFFCTAAGNIIAQDQLPAYVFPELPHLSTGAQIVTKVAFELPTATKGVLQLSAYQWRNGTDSLLVFEALTKTISIPAGLSSRTLKFNRNVSSGGNSWYANTTQMRVLGPVTLSAGQEIAFAAFGLQRIGGNAGCGYRFSKLPLTLRAAVRYARYQLSSAAPAGNLFAGQLGVGWRFAVPLKDPTTEPF